MVLLVVLPTSTVQLVYGSYRQYFTLYLTAPGEEVQERYTQKKLGEAVVSCGAGIFTWKATETGLGSTFSA